MLLQLRQTGLLFCGASRLERNKGAMVLPSVPSHPKPALVAQAMEACNLMGVERELKRDRCVAGQLYQRPLLLVFSFKRAIGYFVGYQP